MANAIIRDIRVTRDLPRLVEISHECFAAPWNADDFRAINKKIKEFIKVLEFKSRIVGYEVYGVRPQHVEIITMAVTPQWQGGGVGKAFVDDHKDTCRAGSALERIHCLVAEDNMNALQFFRHLHFVAEYMVPNSFANVDGSIRDGIQMIWRY